MPDDIQRQLDKIWDSVEDTQSRLVRIETTLLGNPNSADCGLYGLVANNAKRVSKLEQGKRGMVGLGTAAGAIVAGIIYGISEFIRR